MKILNVVGARPQFVKCALISENLKSKGIKEVLVHTGQHYDYNLSGIFFNELNLRIPDYNLGVGSYSHSEQTARMMYELEKVVFNEKPDIVVVYGDTNSTLAGALVASQLDIKIAHIEAGERLGDKSPEETNRIAVDHLADFNFCCTSFAAENLAKEAIHSSKIFIPGDIMLDLFNITMPCALDKSKILDKLGIKEPYVLATIHRAENTNNPERLKNILEALIECGFKVVLPLHYRTERFLKEYKMWHLVKNRYILYTEPVGYIDNLKLIANARCVVTDSGGVSKESAWANKLTIICRKDTEWKELVKVGVAKIADDNRKLINSLIKNAKNNIIWDREIFGHGDAALRIIETLEKQC